MSKKEIIIETYEDIILNHIDNDTFMDFDDPKFCKDFFCFLFDNI